MSWLPPIVTVAPASEPVTLAEVKSQCKIDGTDSDTELNLYITAARTFVEEFTGTRLVSQTVELRCSSFWDFVHLPTAPITAITSITYQDPQAVVQTLGTDIYESVLFGLEPHIRLKLNQSWPALRGSLGMPGSWVPPMGPVGMGWASVSDAITVTATAGYASVPLPIKVALLLIISSWFDSRSIGPVPEGTIALLDSSYRRF